VAKINKVGLMLGRHEEEFYAIDELDTWRKIDIK